jgi:hypothetical protein
LGKSKETWRAYRIILAGYQVIHLFNASRLVQSLGVLEKLAKGAIRFFISICPSVSMDKFFSNWIFRGSEI